MRMAHHFRIREGGVVTGLWVGKAGSNREGRLHYCTTRTTTFDRVIPDGLFGSSISACSV